MRNKIIAAAVAGALLVGAGLATSIVSAPGRASAQEDTTETEEKGFFQRGMDFLSEVLSDLVADDTIDQTQADAIIAAVEAKAEERRAEHQALRELTQEILEDGVITRSEAARLPEDHPFNGEKYDEAWSDGELSVGEIREVRSHFSRGWFRRGAHFGALFDDGGIDRDEYNDLPDDHPLKQPELEQYLEDDGVITPEELREAIESLLPEGWEGFWGSGFRHGSDA